MIFIFLLVWTVVVGDEEELIQPISFDLVSPTSAMETSSTYFAERVGDSAPSYLLVLLMSSTCGACHKISTEILSPLHARMQMKNEEMDVQLAAEISLISVSIADSKHALRAWLSDKQTTFSWPHAIDKGKQIMFKYRVMSVPTLLMLRRQRSAGDNGDGGVECLLIARHSGYSAIKDYLDGFLAHALSEVKIVAESTAVVGVESATTSLNDIGTATTTTTTTTIDTITSSAYSITSILSLSIGSGFFTFFSPCSFALLPSYVSFFIDNKLNALVIMYLSFYTSIGVLLVYLISLLPIFIISFSTSYLFSSSWWPLSSLSAAAASSSFLSRLLSINLISALLTILMGAFLIAEKDVFATLSHLYFGRIKTGLRHITHYVIGKGGRSKLSSSSTSSSSSIPTTTSFPFASSSLNESIRYRQSVVAVDEKMIEIKIGSVQSVESTSSLVLDATTTATAVVDERHPLSILNARVLGGMFFFGVAYGTSSAGCSTPVFIALMSLSFKQSIVDGCAALLVFCLTISLCFIVFSLAIALFRDLFTSLFRLPMRPIRKALGVLLFFVGLNQLLESGALVFI